MVKTAQRAARNQSVTWTSVEKLSCSPTEHSNTVARVSEKW
ncbi:hypothetical protein [Modestobacter excelsi]|nr:hypothetical protein [Modestobacter excelsi]